MEEAIPFPCKEQMIRLYLDNEEQKSSLQEQKGVGHGATDTGFKTEYL